MAAEPTPEPTNKTDVTHEAFLWNANFNGRLGNHMFKYASAFGIANASRHRLILAKNHFMWRDFPKLSASKQSKPDAAIGEQANLHEQKWASFDGQVLVEARTHTRRHLELHGYFQSYKYFEHVSAELREQLTPSNEYTQIGRAHV